MTTLNPPRPHSLPQLTDAQYDRLYLDWHEKISAEVADAIALATGVTHHRERTFTALAADITAVTLAPPRQFERDSLGGRALGAQASLRNAEIFYAQRRLWHAVCDLQHAAREAREVLRDLGFNPRT